jgi:hypothetical protein
MTEEVDFSGAIKNGLERGESLEEIKKSLINSGYDKEQVNLAIQNTNPDSVEYKKPNSPSDRENLSEFGSPAQKFPPLNGNILVKPKKTPKWIKIAIILLILLIIGGVLAFIFKDFLLDFVNDLL